MIFLLQVKSVRDRCSLKFKDQMKNNTLIGTIYRPPDQNVQYFVGSVDQLITKISRENKNCYLMSDFNLNLLSHNSHATTGEFLDVMFSRSFVPLITRPTGLTSHTATLIDNIFTNNIDDIAKSGLLVNDISDHLPVFLLVHLEQSKTLPNYRWISYREINPRNTAKFKDELNNINWFDLPSFNDPVQAYVRFLEKFTILCNKCFPLKRKRARRQARRHLPIFAYVNSDSVPSKKLSSETLA